MQKFVVLNELNRRVGESHHNALLTDAEVETLRSLHFDHGLSYATLAQKYDISERTVGALCRFERRNQLGVRHKAVHVSDEEKG